MSRDPIGTIDGPNLYTYVGSNPIRWTDPTGEAKARCPKKVYLALRGAVLAACQAATRCNESDSCRILRLKIGLKISCAVAQATLTRVCFPHDPSHQQRVEEQWKGVQRCVEILAKKEGSCQC